MSEDPGSEITIRPLFGEAMQPYFNDVGRLRIEVFRDYPYLYDGDLAYEASYSAEFAKAEGAIIVAAFAGATLVGAATGTPMASQKRAWALPLEERGYDINTIFYCAEAVLLNPYRGRGIGHAFFDHREAQARELGATTVCFASVLRPDDHPMRPANYRPLEPFWRKRGYQPLEGAEAVFHWKEVGDEAETPHRLQFWMRDL